VKQTLTSDMSFYMDVKSFNK